jgi:hypothetical protein
MNKKLLVFFGELRKFPQIYDTYKKDGRMNGYDIIVATWDTSNNEPIDISQWSGENIKWIINPLMPTYHNLRSNENCITYHCKKALDSINVHSYDYVVMQRTDFDIELEAIDFNEVRKDSLYRVFNNCSWAWTFMNDIVVVGTGKTCKKHFDAEWEWLFTRPQKSIVGPIDRNLSKERHGDDWQWKPVGQWTQEESDENGIDPKRSRGAIECENITNILSNETKRNYINSFPPHKSWIRIDEGSDIKKIVFKVKE